MNEHVEIEGSGVLFSMPFLAAAAAKSLQSCLTLCDPRDGSPPGSLGFSRQEHWSGSTMADSGSKNYG